MAVLVLYLKESSSELFEQLAILPKAGMLALIGFYALTALHIIAAVIAWTCRKKPEKYRLVLGCVFLLCTVFAFEERCGIMVES